MKIIDLIGVALIVLGILMTALNLMARQPIADVESVTIQEVQPNYPLPDDPLPGI